MLNSIFAIGLAPMSPLTTGPGERLIDMVLLFSVYATEAVQFSISMTPKLLDC